MTLLSRRAAASLSTATVTLGLCLSGCSSPSTPSATAISLDCVQSNAPLALAIGARANDPSPNAALSKLSPLISSAANAQVPISVIRIDGQPQEIFSQTFSTDAGNSGSRQADLDTFLQGLGNVIAKELPARAPQADVLTALTLAAEATTPGSNVVLVDSGLQTVAPLSFQESGLLEADPSDVVNFLRSEKLLPNLKGRHVLLMDLGYTVAPQGPLDLEQQQNVTAIWKQIAQAAGASCVSVYSQPPGSAAVSNVPPVSVVPIPRPAQINTCGDTVLNASNHVNFIENTATFIDPSAARATLQQLADTLQNGQQHVELIGTTATNGSIAYRINLSDERAEAVKQVLVSQGIAASRIGTKGVGTDWPGHVPDIGPGGVLLPGPAEQNREVIAQLSCPGT
jgi:OmpA-OmpF porin, OOP family